MQDRALEAVNRVRSGAGLAPLLLEDACSMLLDEACETVLASDDANATYGSKVLRRLATAGLLDAKHDISVTASRAGLGSADGESSESGDSGDDEKVEEATEALLEALTNNEQVKNLLTKGDVTHVAAGSAVSKSGQLRISLVLFERRARMALASGGNTSVGCSMRGPGGAAAVLAVYQNELSESGIEAVTLSVTPESDAAGAGGPVLGVKLVAVSSSSSSAASSLAVQSTEEVAGLPSSIDEKQLTAVAATVKKLHVPLLEAPPLAPDEGTDGSHEFTAGGGRAYVWPWQLQAAVGGTADVLIPAALIANAPSAAGGANQQDGDEDEDDEEDVKPVARLMAQVVCAPAGTSEDGIPYSSRPEDVSSGFNAFKLMVTDGDNAALSAVRIPILVYPSRPSNHPAAPSSSSGSFDSTGGEDAMGGATNLDTDPSSVPGGFGLGGRGSSSSVGSNAPPPLPSGFSLPTESPQVASASKSGTFGGVSLLTAAGSAAEGARPQHLSAAGSASSTAPLSALVPLSLALEGDGSAGSGPITAIMLVSGANEEDALSSAPEGFELLSSANLAEQCKSQLYNGNSSSGGGGGGACVAHPPAVYLAVQRGGPQSPLVDAGLIVALAPFVPAAVDGEAPPAYPPSVDAPSGYSVQMKDLTLTVEEEQTQPTAAAAASDSAGTPAPTEEGKEGETKEGEGEAASAASAAPPAAAAVKGPVRRVAIRIALLTSGDAEAVTSAIAAHANNGEGPLAVSIADHPEAASAVAAAYGSSSASASSSSSGSSSFDASSGPIGQSRRASVSRSRAGSAGRVRGGHAASMDVVGSGAMDADGIVGVGGQVASSSSASASGSGSGDSDEDAASASSSSSSVAGSAASGAGGKGGGKIRDNDKHREHMLELLAAALQEQEGLVAANARLQRQLGVYFSLRSSDDENKAANEAAAAAAAAAAAGGGGKNAAAAAFAAADKERRYREQLDSVSADREKLANLLASSEREATELQAKVEEKEGRCEQLLKAFSDFKHQIASTAVNSHTGRRIPADELSRYEQLERERDAEVSKVQLRNIHLTAQVEKLTQKLQEKEQVTDGLAMMDFEQLKIENSTLAEKIEDRGEELTKLKKKATVAVQILTHVREKLYFVHAEAVRVGAELAVMEDEVSEQRTMLANAKKERERARQETEKAAHAQGFAHSDKLAIDFERRKRDVVKLRERLDLSRQRLASLNQVFNERTAILNAVKTGTFTPQQIMTVLSASQTGGFPAGAGVSPHQNPAFASSTQQAQVTAAAAALMQQQHQQQHGHYPSAAATLATSSSSSHNTTAAGRSTLGSGSTMPTTGKR